MLRDSWKFAYTTNELAEAAKQKLDYHTERLNFWEDRKTEVMKTIKEEGIDVRESQLSQTNVRRKSWDYRDDTQVTVRYDLNKDLQECSEKLSYHQDCIDDYDSWRQVLAAQGDTTVEVDHQDWLFFFGVKSSS